MGSITVEIRTIDGEDQIIPICADARCFARMLDSTVLTFDTVVCIRTLDYDVEFYPTRGANAVSHSHQPHPQVSGYPHPGTDTFHPNLAPQPGTDTPSLVPPVWDRHFSTLGQTLPPPNLASLGHGKPGICAGTDMRRDRHSLTPGIDTFCALSATAPPWDRHFLRPFWAPSLTFSRWCAQPGTDTFKTPSVAGTDTR
jgi:hypothetical protein